MDNKINKACESEHAVIVANGGNAVLVKGIFGKGGVGRLAKQIKAMNEGHDVFVKDMTSYYYGHMSKSKKEECRKFENLAEDSFFRPFKPVYALREDGTIGVEFVLTPLCVMVINYETINKIKQKRELSRLSRLRSKLARFEHDLPDFAKTKEILYALAKHGKGI